MVVAASVAVGGLASCTSQPLVARKGVSGRALGEMGGETLWFAFAMASGGVLGGAPEARFDNLDFHDRIYLGGIIPIEMPRYDNGTKFYVDGRNHGCLPRVVKIPKPGPHTVRLEIPAFKPYELTLSEVIQVRVGQTEIEAWPPVIVDCLSGEIFTARDTSTVNHDRNSGKRRATELSGTVSKTPLLIVTTTDQTQPGWRKIGQLKAAWGNGVD